MILLLGILLLVYALLIFYYHKVWNQIPVTTPTTGNPVPEPDSALPEAAAKPSPERMVKVSVIVAARNEAFTIPRLLDALALQSYPKELTEIIIVNDFSTDETETRVREHPGNARLLNLRDYTTDGLNSFKKKAIATGIANSSGELIICTDADCRMGPEWISCIISVYKEKNYCFIACPVKIIANESWLSVFQALDFISLQGITGAAVYKNLYPMCNGANLAYTRNAYEVTGGFQGIDQIASGDDMLLMKKILGHFPGGAGYIKDARVIVETSAANTVSAFLHQRIRWASKIFYYKHAATFITLGLVFIVNAGLLLLFISCFFYGHWRSLIILLAFKTISEYFFVAGVAKFFEQESLMKFFPFCQPFHIFYTVVAASFGSFGKYEWKNRKVK